MEGYKSGLKLLYFFKEIINSKVKKTTMKFTSPEPTHDQQSSNTTNTQQTEASTVDAPASRDDSKFTLTDNPNWLGH